MKKFAVILLSGMLFSSAFVAGKGPQTSLPAPDVDWPDSLHSVWYYTEGLKRNVISGDTAQARRLLLEAVRLDSAYAPAYFALASERLAASPDEAAEMARRAWLLDTANLWYERNYGRMLLSASRFPEALERYRRLIEKDSEDPDNYRLLAALYELQRNPYMALATLDTAEMRFGRIPYLSAMKRRMLIATGQLDKAIAETRAAVEEAPYESEHRIVLAGLYGLAKKDSLALAEYAAVLAADSTDVAALISLSDFYNDRRDYRSLLTVNQRIFQSDALPLDEKVKRFGIFTSDNRFYREYYPQINALAATLAVRYPQDPQVVELYAQHLMRSGELEQALALYKLHADDTPPQEGYYKWIIDIESYLQRPDSVDRYVERALERFPDRADFHIAKGNVHIYAGRPDEAIRIYRQSLHYADSDSLRGAIWGLVGDAHHQTAEAVRKQAAASGTTDAPRTRAAVRNAMKSCYAAYDRSLRYEADNALVLNNYAYFLALDSTHLDRALAMSERAVALTDNNPTYLDTQAWVLFRLGRIDEAKRIMRHAIALDARGSAELLVHYGDILHAAGENFLAETYWRKALEKGYDADSIARRITRMKENR
ncbi:MAG: tetratricopeptide repeat protein [Alistipes sp.]|nr:tetratricopeptide repeat protein [Alistipes sp.]